jgi:cytochrome c biogenesis protein CcmG/thiol:disulfide interchange protein DsbE
VNWKRALIGAIVAAAITSLLAFGLTLDPNRVPEPLPGMAAPTFELADLETGEVVRLEDLRDEIVVVNFWASWCGPCRFEHPVLVSVAQRYGQRVRFVGVLHRDSRQNANAFLRELGEFGYPTLTDPGQRTAIDYGLTGVPETFVIGRDGVVAFMKEGPFVDQRELTAVLDRLLAIPQETPDRGQSGGP